MNNKDLYWLAGLLEGEGSFLKGPPSKPNLPILSVITTDEDVCERVANLFGVKYHLVKNKRYQDNNWKNPYLAKLKGSKAVRLMKKLRPLMGKRRQGQIDEALSSYDIKAKRLSNKEVDDIRQLYSGGKMTQTSIAKKLNVRRETVNRIINRTGRYK